MSHEELLELVRQTHEGDQEALKRLVTRFLPLIHACSYGLPIADQQDLQQELVIQLIRLISQYGASYEDPQ